MIELQMFNLAVQPHLDKADVGSRLSSQLNKQLEDYMIKGLKRKGFEFENRIELENFIKSNCRWVNLRGAGIKSTEISKIEFINLHNSLIK